MSTIGRPRAIRKLVRDASGTPAGRAAIGSLVLAACLVVLYGREIADGGRVLPGDMFDGRIADALQLHWSRVFAGHDVWNRPDYFYPVKDTLGYNDGYFLFGVFFAIFHVAGADPFVAAELAGVPFRVAGFLGLYALGREAFGLGRPFALLAATIGLMANNIHLQQVHEQLLTVYLAPCAALLLFRFAAQARAGRTVAAASCGSLAALLVSAWAITAFYMLWFAALFGAFAICAAFAFRPSRLAGAVRAIPLPAAAAPILVASIGLVPFLLVYEPTWKASSGHPWIETALYTVRLDDLVRVGPGNLVASILGGADHSVVAEHSVGLPLTLWVLAALGIAVTVANGRARARAVRLSVALAFVAILPLTMRFGPHAAWRLLAALLPGAGAIRVVCRVMLLLGLVAALLAAVGLEWLHRSRLPRVVIGLLAVLLVAEEVNTGGLYALPRREEDEFLARVPPPPRSCHAFVVTRPRPVAGVTGDTISGSLLVDTDAMLIAELYSLPTPLGDASFKPPEHATETSERQAVLMAGGLRPVCGVDLVSGRWGEVAPVIVRLAPGMRVPFVGALSGDIVAGGWGPPEGGARWSIGPRADLVVRWSEPKPLVLHVEARIGFGLRQHPDRVEIFANDVPVARWPNDPGFADRTLVVPRAAIPPDGIVHLRFSIHDAISTGDAGMAYDDRPLGVAVTSIAAG